MGALHLDGWKEAEGTSLSKLTISKNSKEKVGHSQVETLRTSFKDYIAVGTHHSR